MNKAVLVDRLVERTGINKKDVEALLDALETIIVTTLQTGDEVTLTGFGKFTAKKRHARMGVDPRNPANRIQVPEVIVPKFTAGKTLKDSLNNKS